MRVALFALGLLVFHTTEAAETIWVDTDPAIGAPWREVDDAFALLLAFHSPEVRIAGISTTYGNAGLPRTTAVARDLMRRFGGAARVTDDSVHPGARSPADGSKRTEATEALARTLRKEKVTYVALGPLTNLAAFLRLHPELSGRIKRVIFVGGREPQEQFAFGPTRSFEVHDANVFKDPASVGVVLRSSIPILLTPITHARPLALAPADLRPLRASGAAGNYLVERTRMWLWFWTSVVGEKGGLVFDALAILPAIGPHFLATEERFAQLEAGDLVARRERRRGSRRVQIGTRVRTRSRLFLLKRLEAQPTGRAG